MELFLVIFRGRGTLLLMRIFMVLFIFPTPVLLVLPQVLMLPPKGQSFLVGAFQIKLILFLPKVCTFVNPMNMFGFYISVSILLQLFFSSYKNLNYLFVVMYTRHNEATV